MRLELHPLKMEQSSRLLRYFGWDRFLEVRIPSVETWQHDDDDIAATAARWLTAEPHHFLGRQWSAFYVRDRPLKVEIADGQHITSTKTVFYDRILFFAEKGVDLPDASQLGPRTALGRNSMLDWLLNWAANGSQSYLKLFHRVALGKVSFWGLAACRYIVAKCTQG